METRGRGAISKSVFKRPLSWCHGNLPFTGSSSGGRGGGHIHVGEVELDVPTQDPPHFGERLGPIEQLQKKLILPYEVSQV